MAGFSNQSRPLSKLIGAIEDHWYVILNAIGPLGVAFFLTFIIEWWSSNSPEEIILTKSWYLVIKFFIWNPVSGAILCVLLTIWGAIGQAKDMKSLKVHNDLQNNKVNYLEEEKRKLVCEIQALESKLRVEVENNYQLAEELIGSLKKIAHLWTCQIFNELAFTVKHRISIYYLDDDKKILYCLTGLLKTMNSISQVDFSFQEIKV